MTTNILFRIKEQIDTLPKSEQKIAQKVLENPQAVIQMNATELAETAESSPAAIIRFCHSMKLKGFTELKLRLSADSQQIEEDLYTEILPDEEIDLIKKKLVLNTTHVLNETNHWLTKEQIAEVTECFEKSSMIYTYGLGASYLVALDIQQKYTRIGKMVISSQDAHYLVASMAVAPKNSIFFGISNSGEKKEVHTLLDTAKELGLTTISLTEATMNTLSRKADIALKTGISGEAPLRSAATSSLLTQLYAIDLLFYDYATHNYESILKKLSQSKSGIHVFNQNNL